MIPKIIHWCWLSDDSIPDKLKCYMESWKRYLPDYKIMCWNFNKFPKCKSKWVSDAFDNKKYAFAADYIRMYAIYTYGGIYLDIDVEVIKSFDSLLDIKTMICSQNNWPGLEMAAFGAEKGSKWLKDCLDYYDSRHFINEDGTFNTQPLPSVVESILKKNGYKLIPIKSIEEIGTFNKDMDFPVLSSDYFSPKSFATGKIEKTSNTYCIHHFTGTWLPWYNRLETKICYFFHIKNHAILTSIAKRLGIYR